MQFLEIAAGATRQVLSALPGVCTGRDAVPKALAFLARHLAG